MYKVFKKSKELADGQFIQYPNFKIVGDVVNYQDKNSVFAEVISVWKDGTINYELQDQDDILKESENEEYELIWVYDTIEKAISEVLQKNRCIKEIK